jgi:uncharacterized protein
MTTQLSDLELLVLQPTPFCNIRCDYCYLPDRDVNRRMALSTIRSIFRQLLARVPLASGLTIVWHAGEPMVLPPAYYRQALALIDSLKPTGLKLTHSMQTNGTLITDEWCRFIAEHEVSIGLSIDGPADLHDRYRKTRRGSGTHEQAMRGLRLLREHQIDFHVITVLTREALQQAAELFRFYLDNGITRVGFNIEEIEGIHKRSSLDYAQVERAYRSFLTQFINLMRQQPGTLSVREFDDLTRAIVTTRSEK